MNRDFRKFLTVLVAYNLMMLGVVLAFGTAMKLIMVGGR